MTELCIRLTVCLSLYALLVYHVWQAAGAALGITTAAWVLALVVAGIGLAIGDRE